MDAIRLLDLNDPEIRSDPYPVYRWYRENRPVFLLEGQTSESPDRYLLTRYADVQKHLKNRDLLRKAYKGAFWNRPPDSIPEELHALWKTIQHWPIYTDPPCHAAPRRAINRVLSRETDQVVQVIEDVCETLVEDLPGDRDFDAIDRFAGRIPSEIACRLFGLQRFSSDQLRRDASTIALALSSHFDTEQRREASESVGRVTRTLQRSVEKPPSPHPSEAIWLNGLKEAAGKDALIRTNSIAPLALQMIIGAADTTVNLVGNGIFTFLRHRDELHRFLEKPRAQMDRSAPQEVARFESPVQHIMRHAKHPLEIGGIPIPEGSAVCFVLGAANRDPEFVSNPDEFQVDRDFDDSAAFGHGIHKCPGKDFALVTAASAWRTLFNRFPDLSLSQEKLQWYDSLGLRGLKELRVSPGGGKTD